MSRRVSTSGDRGRKGRMGEILVGQEKVDGRMVVVGGGMIGGVEMDMGDGIGGMEVALHDMMTVSEIEMADGMIGKMMTGREHTRGHDERMKMSRGRVKTALLPHVRNETPTETTGSTDIVRDIEKAIGIAVDGILKTIGVTATTDTAQVGVTMTIGVIEIQHHADTNLVVLSDLIVTIEEIATVIVTVTGIVIVTTAEMETSVGTMTDNGIVKVHVDNLSISQLASLQLHSSAPPPSV